jgi:hypothetical protein
MDPWNAEAELICQGWNNYGAVEAPGTRSCR